MATPSDCRRLEALLDRDFDGELRPDQEEFVAEHIETCPLCRQRRRFLREVRGAIDGALHDEPLPPGMADRVLRRLDALVEEEP